VQASQQPEPSRAAVAAEAPPFDGPFDNAAGNGDEGYAEYAQATHSRGDSGAKKSEPGPLAEPAVAPAQPEPAPVAGSVAPVRAQAQSPIESAPPVLSSASASAREAAIPQTAKPATAPLSKVPLSEAAPDNWPQIYLGLGVGGILQSTVSNCVLVGRQGNQLSFILDEANSTLYDEGHQQRLADLLSDYFGEPVRALIQPGSVAGETPAAIASRLREERQADAVAAIKNDPLVQRLLEHFGAQLREDTIEPVG
jgi:DNA polymerase-3 subunit gamma/tau